jgi:hypothetical protein
MNLIGCLVYESIIRPFAIVIRGACIIQRRGHNAYLFSEPKHGEGDAVS